MFKSSLFVLVLVTFLSNGYAASIHTRIVQGKDATRGQFPYYAYLRIQRAQGGASCGANLISDQWVLTAAHCLQDALGGEVHLGSLRVHDLSEEGRVVAEFDDDSYFVHQQYSSTTVKNDIALIKLSKPVQFSDVIQPVKLACKSTKDLNVVAIGNGLMNSTETTLAPILQWTNELFTVPAKTCTKAYGLRPRKGLLCVEGVDQKSICSGDSGGPLVSEGSEVLVGLTSFGSAKGCHLGLPQGYTDIQYYFPWIKKITGLPLPKCRN